MTRPNKKNRKPKTEAAPQVDKDTLMLELLQKMNNRLDRLEESVKSRPAVEEKELAPVEYNEDYMAKWRPYKLLLYTGEYTDQNGQNKRQYQLPGRTYKTYADAKAAADRLSHKNYEIVPV